MKVLILGLNYGPEQTGIGPYTRGFAEEMAARGHEITVICAPPHFPTWRIAPGYSKPFYKVSRECGVTVVRCPTYIPQSTGAARRIVHYLSFMLSSIPMAIIHAARLRPQVVFCVAPSLLSSPAALVAARYAKAKSWLHVQDFEVGAAVATGVLRHGRWVRLAQRLEASILSRFDRVSSISPAMVRRLAGKGVLSSRTTEFRNWSSLDEIYPLTHPSIYRKTWKITHKYIALYSGSIGNKQGIEVIVAAAKALVEQADLLFVICGEGPNRPRLEKLARGLPNILFKDLQPSDKLNELLALATVHLVPQLPGSADNFLPSKLTNILASGRPVIAMAEENSGLSQEIKGFGLCSRPGEVDSFVQNILFMIWHPAEAECMGRAASAYAVSSLSSRKIFDQVEAQMKAISGMTT